MATFKGSSGIDKLKQKIKLKTKRMISDAVNYSTTYITAASPYGSPAYGPDDNPIYEKEGDVGEFKNSWFATTNLNTVHERDGNTGGSDSIDSGNSFFANYNLQETMYIVNGALHAKYVEEGWYVSDFPERASFSQPDKDGYHITTRSKGVIKEIFKNSINDNKGD